jgi:hypothetical protein
MWLDHTETCCEATNAAREESSTCCGPDRYAGERILSTSHYLAIQRYAVILDLGLIACLAPSWRVLRYPSRPSERRRSRGDPTALTTAVGSKKEGRGFRPRPSSSRLIGFASTVWLQTQSTYLGTPPATSCAGMVSTVSMSLVNSTYSSSISARGLKSGLAMMPCTRRRCMPMLPPS